MKTFSISNWCTFLNTETVQVISRSNKLFDDEEIKKFKSYFKKILNIALKISNFFKGNPLGRAPEGAENPGEVGTDGTEVVGTRYCGV